MRSGSTVSRYRLMYRTIACKVHMAIPLGDSLISTSCEVVPDQPLDRPLPTGWITVRYRWNSVFTPEDKARGPNAQDMVTEEEVVLFEQSAPGEVRAVRHARFDIGPYAIWASVTPEVVQTSDGKTLLSVMSCVNGTGGCGQVRTDPTSYREVFRGEFGMRCV